MIDHRVICRSCLMIACLVVAPLEAAHWQVARVNHMVLAPPAGVTVAEMSGVTYLGQFGGQHRFIAARENRPSPATQTELVQFELTLSANGAINAISSISIFAVSPNLDYEGIAYTNAARNSVFISDENNTGLRELSLGTGAQLQAVTLPAVFANRRANLSLESLTRSPDGSLMYTANEQALTVDGPTATSAAGTNVRLLQLNVTGDAVAVGPQFVYPVEPIHGTSPLGSPQSGLSDLVAMPDGTLLALERSVSFLASPSTYLNRIYQVSFAGATDVSVGAAANGLIGQQFTPVGKQLLWSGPIDGTNGQNLEGLALGPRLPNGDWVLIGVVDDGDDLSNNTIVAFTASPVVSADFDNDGDTDGADYLNWQRGLGKTIGAVHADGDADRDGDVDATDLSYWRNDFASVAIASEAAAVPEPAGISLALVGAIGVAAGVRRRRVIGVGDASH